MSRLALAVLLILTAAAAQAQIRLPTVQLPALPAVQGPLNGVTNAVNNTVTNTTNTLTNTVGRLGSQIDSNAARLTSEQQLIRNNRTVLEADPNGAAMVRNEIVALSPTDADLQIIQAAGFAVGRIRVLDGLDTRIVVLQAPQGMSTARALTRARALLPGDSFDFNHLYGPSGEVGAENSASGSSSPDTVPAAAGSVRVGLIDSGVDGTHPVFKDLLIARHGCGEIAVPEAHGTAVASLLVGRAQGYRGAASGAQLYAADVYCGQATGGAVDAVAEALSWLVRERVPVINVSLVGPANVTLAAVVRLVIARGFLIVAAVGNDGPAAPPLYPASYPGVIGVTAVDAHRRVLIEAARGPQVRFAAPGADMVAARSPEAFAPVRGTSFAAPLVAGLLAGQLHEPDQAAAARAVENLAHQAIDLGARGPDPVYGYGLVAAELGPDMRLAGNRSRSSVTSTRSFSE
jgi:subtilisin family serine protease